VYTEGKSILDRIYEKEIEINLVIRKLITDKYGRYFQGNFDIENGKWSEQTTRDLLKEILNDGDIRYHLSVKHINLISKMNILEDQIMSKTQLLIESHKIEE